MPKERFHFYLADEVLSRCRDSLPCEVYSEATGPQSLMFSIGAISPDIFFYDLPFFSLSPLGDALHDLVERKTISIIFDWIAHTRTSETGPRISEKTPGPTDPIPRSAGKPTSVAGKILWGLGFASHFLADAAWHPAIDELSRSRSWTGAASREPRAGNVTESVSFPPPASRSPFFAVLRRTSETERHRLLESELEGLRLAGSPAAQKYDDLLKEFARDRRRIFEIASSYRRFLEFVGLSSQGGPPARPGSRAGVSPLHGAEVLENRIVRCFLLQNFLLRLFANRTLGGRRDRLLSLWPFLGVLVTPVRPVLPALFSSVLPRERDLFSDYFMERSLACLELHFCALAQRLSQIFTRQD